MAIWDNADLLARLTLIIGRDKLSSDASMTAPNYYTLLTDAQAHYYNVFAAQVPYVLMGAPAALATADSGVTYTFGSGVTPLAVEVYDASYRLLKPGAFWDPSADYVWEGTLIRFPRAIARQQAYYARWIAPPGIIDASTAPTLVPAHTRLLLVYRAAGEWANRGGMRDPAPFIQMENRYWLGNPETGDLGVLGALKMQNPWLGGAAYTLNQGLFDNVASSGYQRVG